MALFKCKMCGGTLDIQEKETIAVCEYCGTKQTVPRLDDERKANLYDRANHLRRNNEYDKAMNIYEQLLNEDGTDSEAYWSLVLCRYGVEYVDDPKTHKRIPTVNRAQFTSVFDDDNYKMSLHYADEYQKEVLEEEAKIINEIQKGILAISQQEDPFDIFICYKETDNNGRRTHDSVLAQELYYQLKQEGFNVFFSRITLEDKLGTAYEPYIFAALNSAKVMVVLGTRPEHFNAVWVKNEWSRYLALIKHKQNKVLIPAYKDMDPYDLPEEFSHLQAQDMSKLGFMQDLIRGIKKIVHVEEHDVEAVTEAPATNINPLLRRAQIFLEDGNVESANEYCEKVLDINPECGEAYLIKLLIDLGKKTKEDLKTNRVLFDNNLNFQKVIRYGSSKLKQEMSYYINCIKENNELERKKQIYDQATIQLAHAKSEAEYLNLSQRYLSISEYKDAKMWAEKCLEKAEEVRKDTILAEGKAYISKSNFMGSKGIGIEDYELAINKLNEILGWKDADELIIECKTKIEEIKIIEEKKKEEKERFALLLKQKSEQRKKNIKKFAIIALPIIIVGIIIGLIYEPVISPMIDYKKAELFLDEGYYDEAIELFEELKGYKDSSNKILEVQYKKASSLLAKEKYLEAIAIFKSLKNYEDSSEQYFLATLKYAQYLLKKNDLDKTMEKLKTLSEYNKYEDEVDELYGKLMEAYEVRGMYKEALLAYRQTKGFSTISNTYKSIMYKYASNLYNNKQYSEAKELFLNIKGYSDSNAMIKECDYQYAMYKFYNNQYIGAIDIFSDIKSYKNSEEFMFKAMYLYVKNNKNTYDTNTYKFLKEMKSANYSDSASIFESLYSWKVAIIANTSEEGTEDMTVIKEKDKVCFHILLTGGEPNETTKLKYVVKWSNRTESKGDWGTYVWKKGSTGKLWVNGLIGSLKIIIYDQEGFLIGQHTIMIS